MPKVLVGPSHLATLDGGFRTTLKQAGFELVFPPKPVQMTENDLLRQLDGVSASVAGSEPYTRTVFAKNPGLKVVARAGVGYDAVDVQAATDHGVVVTITPGANQDAVAEHTFMLMLALAKNLIGQNQPIKDGKWPRYPGLPLRGRTLGLLGLGRIGKTVALRSRAFGMNIVAYEPFPDRAFIDANGVVLTTQDEVLRQADYVSLHMPASESTKRLIDKRALSLMKPTAFLINTARGALVNEQDLAAALREKKLAGAGLDVFEEEPPLPDNPLFKLDNVLLTAHTAGVDIESRDEMALKAAQCIAHLSRGEWPAECVVNPEVKAKFHWKG
jgi:D-3-phosphoglycerate dehydrogenase / 2-oxoglutarate reductase